MHLLHFNAHHEDSDISNFTCLKILHSFIGEKMSELERAGLMAEGGGSKSSKCSSTSALSLKGVVEGLVSESHDIDVKMNGGNRISKGGRVSRGGE